MWSVVVRLHPNSTTSSVYRQSMTTMYDMSHKRLRSHLDMYTQLHDVADQSTDQLIESPCDTFRKSKLLEFMLCRARNPLHIFFVRAWQKHVIQVTHVTHPPVSGTNTLLTNSSSSGVERTAKILFSASQLDFASDHVCRSFDSAYSLSW